MVTIRTVALVVIAAMTASTASPAQEKHDDDAQRRSGFARPVASSPRPFNTNGPQDVTAPAISTGYYFLDSDDPTPDPWRPSPGDYVDTTIEPGTWKRIVSGPNQRSADFWRDPARNTYGGDAYFRDPANPSDSTDDAFAGPISIGFPFYFNGVRYDSFYVSTNGLVVLSNRRYWYATNLDGWPVRRQLVSNDLNQPMVYDPASDDLRARPAGPNDTNDAVADDWGYRFIACGGDPSRRHAGIRSGRNGMLTDSSLAAVWPPLPDGRPVRPALIAPCWDDMQVSVYDRQRNVVDDFGRVYYKRSPATDKLIISFVNLTPIGPKTVRVGARSQSVMFPPDHRRGLGSHYAVNVQVHLDRRDSSVTFHFGELARTTDPTAPVIDAGDWIRCNATIGVYGPARRLDSVADPRHVLDYSKPTYPQGTEYLVQDGTEPTGSVRAVQGDRESARTPKSYLAIKFKQWKNLLRVVSMGYRVRPLNNNSTLDFTVVVPPSQANNYEMLSGETRLGAIQPVAIVQNVSNEIQGPQGVNYTPQGINFKVRFRIVNWATGKILYNTTKTVTDAALRDTVLSGIQRCDINGVPLPFAPAGTFVRPYEYIKATFPPFEPDPFIDDQLGRLRPSVIVEPKDSLNRDLGDQWPFDDTLEHTIFKARRLSEFRDDLREYHVLKDGQIVPGVLTWMTLGADVVDGLEYTSHPPAPNGERRAANSDVYILRSPLIRLDRLDHRGNEIPQPGTYGGDEIRSFPIDLTRKKKAALSFSVQRAGKIDRSRGFSDNVLRGPEHRVNARMTSIGEGFTRKPDELIVEFARPSDDQLNNIMNVSNWAVDLARFDALYTPPFRLFGGGGHVWGYDMYEPGRQLDRTDHPLRGGMREDVDDDGKDELWTKVYIPIPDTILRWNNEGARNFRFRIRASCLNNAMTPEVQDDNDPFYVDNIKISMAGPDAEVMDARLVWPYTTTTPQQLGRVPVHVRLANVGVETLRNVDVNVRVSRPVTPVRVYLQRVVRIDSVAPGQVITIDSLRVNLRRSDPGFIEVRAWVATVSADADQANDTAMHLRVITKGPALAYDAYPTNPTNDVQDARFANIRGLGLNLGVRPRGADALTFLYGGRAVPMTQFMPMRSIMTDLPGALDDDARYGASGGDGSGRIAVRFTLDSADTLSGYQAYWASMSGSPDPVRYAVLPDSMGWVASTPIPGTTLERGRGYDDLDPNGELRFDAMTTALLPQRVVLPAGTYWVTVAQLGQIGFNLGASATRSAMVTTMHRDDDAIGDATRSILIDHDLRDAARAVPGSLGLFAVEHGLGTGNWTSLTPAVGPMPFAHTNSIGTVRNVPTFTQGSWIPLLRPYFGPGRGGVVEKPSDDVQDVPSTTLAGRPTTADPTRAFTLAVSDAAPNPTSGPVHLFVHASEPGKLIVVVRDVLGNIVRSLDPLWIDALPVRVTWDGRTDDGELAATGRYSVHCIMQHGTVTRSVAVRR